jgi:hypothetical protein
LLSFNIVAIVKLKESDHADLSVPSNRSSAVAAKWHEAADAGFQLLPDVLIKNQSTLELSSTELVVLINLTMHWWYAAQKPFPRSGTIAARMGVEVRTVQRAITHLSELGLIKRIKVQTEDGESSVIDLDGLVSQLCKLAVTDPSYLHRRAGKPLSNE